MIPSRDPMLTVVFLALVAAMATVLIVIAVAAW